MSTKNPYFTMTISCDKTSKLIIDKIIMGSIQTLMGCGSYSEDSDLNSHILFLITFNMEQLHNLINKLFDCDFNHYMELEVANRLDLRDAVDSYLQGCIDLLNLLFDGGKDNDQKLIHVLTLNFESIKDLIKGMK